MDSTSIAKFVPKWQDKFNLLIFWIFLETKFYCQILSLSKLNMRRSMPAWQNSCLTNALNIYIFKISIWDENIISNFVSDLLKYKTTSFQSHNKNSIHPFSLILTGFGLPFYSLATIFTNPLFVAIHRASPLVVHPLVSGCSSFWWIEVRVLTSHTIFF